MDIDSHFVKPLKNYRSLGRKMFGTAALPVVAAGATYPISKKYDDKNPPLENTALVGGSTGVVSGLLYNKYYKNYHTNALPETPDSNTIAILTSHPNAGAGHFTQALALKEELANKGYNVDIVDAHAYENRVGKYFAGRSKQSLKTINSKKGKDIEQFMARTSITDADDTKTKFNKWVWNKTHVPVTESYGLKQDLDNRNYKLIVNNTPGADKALKGSKAKIITTPTDYGIINNLWETDFVKDYALADNDTAKSFKQQFPNKNVYVTGSLPVGKEHLLATENYDHMLNKQRDYLKDDLLLNPDLETLSKNRKKYIVVTGGNLGVGVEKATDATWKALKRLKKDKEYNVVAISGKGNLPQHIKLVQKYHHVDSVIPLSSAHTPSLFRNADAIITRPGGSTTTELLVHGKPVITYFNDSKFINKLRNEGKATHEIKNADILSKNIDAMQMFTDNDLSAEYALDKVLSDTAYKEKVKNLSKKYQRTSGSSALANLVDKVYKDLQPLKKEKVNLKKGYIPAALGASTLLAGLWSKYNDKKRK